MQLELELESSGSLINVNFALFSLESMITAYP